MLFIGDILRAPAKQALTASTVSARTIIRCASTDSGNVAVMISCWRLTWADYGSRKWLLACWQLQAHSHLLGLWQMLLLCPAGPRHWRQRRRCLALTHPAAVIRQLPLACRLGSLRAPTHPGLCTALFCCSHTAFNVLHWPA
jgi:hypothetical protein